MSRTQIFQPPREHAGLPAREGFTLVEILIVVVILGILAAIVVPQFTNASTESQESAVRSTLQTVRSQLTLFRAQHNDITVQAPGMWNLLVGRSDPTETDVTTGVGTACGPYLSNYPVNPLNNLTGVSASDPDSAAGWYYTAVGADCTIYARDQAGNAITQW